MSTVMYYGPKKKQRNRNRKRQSLHARNIGNDRFNAVDNTIDGDVYCPTPVPPLLRRSIDYEEYNFEDISESDDELFLKGYTGSNNRQVRAKAIPARTVVLNHSKILSSPTVLDIDEQDYSNSNIAFERPSTSTERRFSASGSASSEHGVRYRDVSSSESGRSRKRSRRRSTRSSSANSTHDDHGSDAIRKLVDKYSEYNKPLNFNIDVSGMLKDVISNVMNAPDIKSMISDITHAKQSNAQAVQSDIKKMLTTSVFENTDLIKLASSSKACSSDVVQTDIWNNGILIEPQIHRQPDCNTKNESISSSDDESDLSLIQSYIKNIFIKSNVPYQEEGSKRESLILLIDYKAQYILRDPNKQMRILPPPVFKTISLELYCQSCQKDFPSLVAKADHEFSYLHLMVTGDWWKVHTQPPKYFPLVSSLNKQKTFIWCIVCFEKRGMDSNEELFQHIKSTHHQYNRYCWKERFDTFPIWEWCLWKDVSRMNHSLPKTTVNGYDWSKDICILPDL